MISYIKRKRQNILYRVFSAYLIFTFLLTSVIPSAVYAQVMPELILPPAGTMILKSEGFTPTIVRGLTIHPENPLRFDFIVDTGDANLEGEAFKEETTKLIKYFLASLTVPEKEMWVNLSPYEKDRVIPESLGITDLGVDLLGQDYILKQLTASLIYPERELGKKFWNRVYTKAKAQYGTTEIPINTFNKVWIIPDKAVVYENNGSEFVVERHLKVMLEQDYLALQNNLQDEENGTTQLKQSDY